MWRHVEHAGVAAHLVVLVDLRAVVDRHVPAAEVDHLGAERAVGRVEDGLLSGLDESGAASAWLTPDQSADLRRGA